MKRIEFIYLLTGFCTICSCTSKANSEIKEVITEVHNTVTEAIWKSHSTLPLLATQDLPTFL
ncbi:hypothetical protein DXB82_15445, partial [Phocaeicola vulgatus]